MDKDKEKILAIFCSDIHLSLKSPIFRSAEPDWLKAQERPLDEVRVLQQKYNCPILCAGDVFDKWNCSPELINWAIMHLPPIYAIPGQHDLPNHQLENIRKSAFWTLVKADVITEIKFRAFTIHKLFEISGFPFGKDISEPNICSHYKQKIAIIHDYIWIPGYSYPNAPIEKKFDKAGVVDNKWLGYDVIIYGDNHKGFCIKKGDTTIFNCGTLMRRKSDEIDYRPQVGLLTESGKVIPYYLDISKDKYIETIKPEQETNLNMSGFFDELEKLGKSALDFVDNMKEFMHRGKTIKEVKRIVLEAMEK